MQSETNPITFKNTDEVFTLNHPDNYTYLYFPVAGEQGIKSSVTPSFAGDSKLDQNTFLLEPVSSENLHNNRSSRNFWCRVEGAGAWSATGVSAEAECDKYTACQDECSMEAGFMWQTVTRISSKYKLKSTVTSFVPVDHNVELLHVVIENTAESAQKITPVAAVPIYGRSADNIRDHRHVTSLLHQITVTGQGVAVKPKLSFDERGHQKNQITYFVYGVSGNGEAPEQFFPVTEDFIGEGGSLTAPLAVKNGAEGVKAGTQINGKEALGGLQFRSVELKSAETAAYTIIIGATAEMDTMRNVVAAYNSTEKVQTALRNTQNSWQDKVNVSFQTGDKTVDSYLRWICFQPILRRLYGCSFLPHHDYGKGGRGWRDLWQDCLSLLFMNPDGVRQMIVDNYGGVRIDGTNATIIGERQGEFKADRNSITRVWMDHGFWPFLTTKLYIDQTGDIAILGEKVPYFKDKQIQRGLASDSDWDESYGMQQKTQDGVVYTGSIMEHILLQQLCAFYEVGAHNHIRLRNADWNDALDMAPDKGESVAFTSAYAYNLRELAAYLEKYEAATKKNQLELTEEIAILLAGDMHKYEEIEWKRTILNQYVLTCTHNISGRTVLVSIAELAQNLRDKAAWVVEHIRRTEWVTDTEGNGWFNGYYDNNGNQVEGVHGGNVRMMLTSQVFSIMSGTADKEMTAKICQSADKYLYREKVGGYRLNTKFDEDKFDLGRMFGFAYGEKENGAVFSHMTVMFANALYQRGFVKEGYKALHTLLATAMDFETSKIYPGVPEYFDADGRGMYHYLTGAASWFMLTMITEVYGVRGDLGNLVLAPKLMAEQFDADGNASIQLNFLKKTFLIRYHNPGKQPYGAYHIERAVCGDIELKKVTDMSGAVYMEKETIESLDSTVHVIDVMCLKNID
ncbi:MAG: cellobiose phosphorylase [Lachnospiraceae bacterium]|nr:cellobiose phosphorylase [Lachnospiraceae bacterium]